MRSLTLALAALVAAPAVQAATYTLDFSGPICLDTSTDAPDDTTACTNAALISQAYGDEPGVDVVYDSDLDLAGNQELAWWDLEYSNLQGVAYNPSGSGREATISFLASPGYEVGLTSLSLGAWRNQDRSLGFTIMDLANISGPISEPIQVVSGTVASVFNFNIKSMTGLKITFSGEFFNGGVDNIVYSSTFVQTDPVDPVDPVDPTDPSVVPLPASALLLLAGLGGLGVLRRRTSAG